MIRSSMLGWSGALAVLAFIVAACGSSTTGTAPGTASLGTTSPSASTPTSTPTSIPGGSASDPCTLITQQEATIALGSDPGSGKPHTPTSGGTGCLYAGNGHSVEVDVSSGDRTLFDAMRAQIQLLYQQRGGTSRDETGVGDAAYEGNTSQEGVILLLKGSALVKISVSSAAVPNVTRAQTLTNLGGSAAGRL